MNTVDRLKAELRSLEETFELAAAIGLSTRGIAFAIAKKKRDIESMINFAECR
ncbi:MAG: hypothetical protein ACYC99_08960 [Candidatus Geothermincolia bacterium]